MLTALLLAAAIVIAVPLPLVVIGWVAAWQPVLALSAVAVLVVLDRRRRPPRAGVAETDRLRSMAADLDAGASLRFAVAALGVREDDPALRRSARLAMAGVPIGEVTTGLAAAFPVSGGDLVAAVDLAAGTGARLAALLRRLAARAEERARIERERRGATAQARLSAAVVGVAPVAFTALLVAGGAVPAPWDAPGPLALISAIGFALELAGLAVVVALLRRHSR